MKIDHPHIEVLERFALQRSSIPPEEIPNILDLVAEIADLKEYTVDLDEKLVDLETARIMRMIPVSGYTAVNKVILRIQPASKPDAAPNGFALAAKSEGLVLDYQPVATLYSDDGHTLLRILHERGDASYFFQLMSEQLDHIPHALLVAPGKEPMMTDVGGSFRIADSELDIVQIVSMSVYYALDRIRPGSVETHELTSHEGVLVASEDSTVHFRAIEDGIEVLVRWHGSDATPPRYLGAVSSGAQAVGVIENGKTHLALSSFDSDCVIVLY
jgi:hypothetical protein